MTFHKKIPLNIFCNGARIVSTLTTCRDIVDRISIRTSSMLTMHLHTPPAKFVKAQSLRTLQPLKNEYSTCQIREGSKPQKYSTAKMVKAPIPGSTWQKQSGPCWSSGDLYTHNMPKITANPPGMQIVAAYKSTQCYPWRMWKNLGTIDMKRWTNTGCHNTVRDCSLLHVVTRPFACERTCKRKVDPMGVRTISTLLKVLQPPHE